MDVLSRTGGVPNQLRVTVFKRTTEPDVNGFFELTWTPIEVNLYEGELIKSRWLEHPLLGRHVDVAAIDVTEVCSGYEIKYVNEIESDAVLEVSASQDLFIIGFPFGMIANAPSPIWKRGTVALDPTFDPDGLPKMLVDTTSREGMSGSVVVARHIVVGRQYLKKDGTESPPILYGRHDTVVGIYSGRQYPDLEKAQLGIVWKRRLIEETVTGGKPAEVYF